MNMICHVDFGANKISDSVSKRFIQGPARCEVVLLPVTEQLVKLISAIWKTCFKTVCLNAAETEMMIVYMCTKNTLIFKPLFFGINDKKWRCSLVTKFYPFIRLDVWRTHFHQNPIALFTEHTCPEFLFICLNWNIYLCFLNSWNDLSFGKFFLLSVSAWKETPPTGDGGNIDNLCKKYWIQFSLFTQNLEYLKWNKEIHPRLRVSYRANLSIIYNTTL